MLEAVLDKCREATQTFLNGSLHAYQEPFLLFLMLTAGCCGRFGVIAVQPLQEPGRGDPLPRVPVQNFKFSIAAEGCFSLSALILRMASVTAPWQGRGVHSHSAAPAEGLLPQTWVPVLFFRVAWVVLATKFGTAQP